MKGYLTVLCAVLLGIVCCPEAYAAKKPKGSMTQKEYLKEKKKEEKQEKKAIRDSKKAAALLSKKLAKLKLINPPDARVKEEEVEELQAKADQGDTDAMVRLGHHAMNKLEEGVGSAEEALGYFQKAADAGNADALAWHALAQYQLARRRGETGKAGMEFMLEDCKAAAEKGSLIGAYLTALVNKYFAPASDNPDLRLEAVNEMRAVAEKGFVPAMRQLGECMTEYNFHVLKLHNSYTPDAKMWMTAAAKAGDYYAYLLLSSEGGNYVGLASERPNIDYKAIEAQMLNEALPLIKKIQPSWYGNTFHTRVLVNVFSWGGEKSDAYLTWCSDMHSLQTNRMGKNPQKVRADLVNILRKIADEEGDQDAMVALVYLYLKWGFWFGKHIEPPPYDEAPYMQKLREQMDAGDNRLKLKMTEEPGYRRQHDRGE